MRCRLFPDARKVLPQKTGPGRANLVKCFSVQFPPEAVREIAQLLSESDLGEISFEAAPGQRLTLKRKPKFVGAPATAPASAQTALESADVAALAPDDSSADSGALMMTSPCVGVFHAAKEAVEVGSLLRAKQLVGTVESLKVPNDLNAPVAGVISQMWVSDGQGVEWGQPLFEIAPSETAASKTSGNATPEMPEFS